ncbi:MAG TPA: PVC-type heme-binding CxxCH protein [Planctomycetaceae bacterium]|nr:PVC-type heme-binding CxxCH protein [Planctomycetaceae bacterium]
MRRPVACLLSALLVASGAFSTPAFAAETRLNGHTFTLPDGFEIELIAGPPLVDRPITADFDDEGRLYVADSSGSNDPVQKQLAERPHRIVRLEDTDGDGVFDASVVFADRMMFPEGTLWHDGSLYVAAPPSIWKLTDTDGDGVADERIEWFQGKTLTGCANDLHGPYLGPDGWIYWCKGAFAEQHHVVHGKPWSTRASHIFRCRPDGSGLEPVMTGGMDNPVDVAFLPEGERVLTNTFLVHPGNGQRDGLLHAVYGGVYGKSHGVLDGHPRTGDLMPVLAHMGPAAPCGLTRYESNVFGDEYRDNLFACQFNLRKVSRHVLRPAGASYTSADSDFVVSDNHDFHPTDVLEDADGSLLVVDTGGWYKLCCPTSQLWKPDVLGAIYRIRRTEFHSVLRETESNSVLRGNDAARIDDPRGRQLAWEEVSPDELARRLADERPAVRWRAVRELAKCGERAVSHLAALACAAGSGETQLAGESGSVAVRQLAVWALTRIDAPQARAAVRAALADPDAGVRQAALHSVSLWRDGEAVPKLLNLLARPSLANRRAAAEALGRIGHAAAVPHLLIAASAADDRFLEHSILYALVELDAAAATAEGLASESPRTQRAALIALDQMSGGGLHAEQVQPLLGSDSPILRETAAWLVQRHPEWGGELAGWFRMQLRNVSDREPAGTRLLDDRHAELRGQLVQFAMHPAIQELLAESGSGTAVAPAARELALRVIAESAPRALPPVWAEALAVNMQSGDPSFRALAIAAARRLPAPDKDAPPAYANALLAAAGDGRLDAQARLDAMAAVPGGLAEPAEADFEFLAAHLDTAVPVPLRSAAADAISKARLKLQQLHRLAGLVKTAGPLELHRLLDPYERSTDERLGLALVAALRDAEALASLRIDALRQRLAKYSPTVHAQIDELESLVNVDAATQRQRIDELLPLVAQGDIRRGQAVFNNTKAACIVCHRFGYVGGNSGPDLTRIGPTRTERDLLEAILYPSLSFVRSYEPVTVVTTSGRVLNGLVRNETAEEITLATGPNEEARVRRDEIDELRPGTVSIMPAGLDKQLTPQELADLVAFLKNAK